MLTTKMQVQALADRLAGLPVSYKARDFTAPFQACWQGMDGAPAGSEYLALSAVMQQLPEREWLAGAIFAATPGARLGAFPSLAELAPDLPPIEWVWKGWLPRGLLSLLGAAPGAGKSLLALDLARRIIHGAPFPDGQPAGGPGAKVIYVDSESIPHLILKRVSAWQMDLRQLHLLLPCPAEMLDFSLAGHRDRLVEMTAELRPELVVIDSLSSISSKGENSVEDVRALLSFLSALALDFRTALLLVHHLRKGGGPPARPGEVTPDDLRGSGHILAMARTTLGLSLVQTGPKPDRNGPRRLEVIKTNLGPYPDALGFELAPLPPDDVRLVWGEVPAAYHAPTRLEEAVAWLSSLLRTSAAPLRPAQVMALAQEEGFNRCLVYRARQQLNGQISNTHGHQHPDNAWEWMSDPGATDAAAKIAGARIAGARIAGARIAAARIAGAPNDDPR